MKINLIRFTINIQKVQKTFSNTLKKWLKRNKKLKSTRITNSHQVDHWIGVDRFQSGTLCHREWNALACVCVSVNFGREKRK